MSNLTETTKSRRRRIQRSPAEKIAVYLRIMKKLREAQRELQLNQHMTPTERLAGTMIDELLSSEWALSYLKVDDERNQAI